MHTGGHKERLTKETEQLQSGEKQKTDVAKAKRRMYLKKGKIVIFFQRLQSLMNMLMGS